MVVKSKGNFSVWSVSLFMYLKVDLNHHFYPGVIHYIFLCIDTNARNHCAHT